MKSFKLDKDFIFSIVTSNTQIEGGDKRRFNMNRIKIECFTKKFFYYYLLNDKNLSKNDQG